jgi:hypothetical protein
MRISDFVSCNGFPCMDVNKEAYYIPRVELDPGSIKAIMISEASPANASDNYYSEGDPLFQRTTVQAFGDAGLEVKSIHDLVALGFYFTLAVKCGKVGYGVGTETVKTCSRLLEKELYTFPNLRVIMLMGDVAIKAFNEVSKRRTGKRVIPGGSTYKIRSTPYFYGDIRVFPSYLQAGPSFFIERKKREMIAEDITGALRILKG